MGERAVRSTTQALLADAYERLGDRDAAREAIELSDELTASEDVVNRAMRKLLAQSAFKGAPYPNTTDFLKLLRAEAGPRNEQVIADLFEKITILDLKTGRWDDELSEADHLRHG